MAYIEMRWRCAYCGKENLGRDRECAGCLHPRDENVKFYMPGKEERHRVEKIENTKPDWICGFCNCLNKATVSTCAGCGASRTADTQSYFDNKPGYSGLFDLEGNHVSSMDELNGGTSGSGSIGYDASDDDSYSSLAGVFAPEAGYLRQQRKKASKRFFIICAAIILVILGAKGIGKLAGWIRSTPKKCTVESIEWNVTAEIEKERTFRESDWELPSGARCLNESEEIHHYNDVLDHYETVTEQRSRQVLDHYETVEEQKSRQVLDHYETVEERKSRRVIDHYEDVVVGYRDLGNGYAEEITRREPVYETEYYTESHREPVYETEYYTVTHEEPVYRTEYYTEDVQKPVYNKVPVYRTYYTYDIERWVFARTATYSSGAVNKAGAEFALNDNERVGKIDETCYFTVRNKRGKEYHLRTTKEVLETIRKDSVIKVNLNYDCIFEVEVLTY